MAGTGSMLRQDCFKVAEARVRCGARSRAPAAVLCSCSIVFPVLLSQPIVKTQLNTKQVKLWHLCQVRALTREVGSLKEDLRREVKRRERAIISAREAEELRAESDKRVKQLEYSKRCAIAT